MLLSPQIQQGHQSIMLPPTQLQQIHQCLMLVASQLQQMDQCVSAQQAEHCMARSMHIWQALHL